MSGAGVAFAAIADLPSVSAARGTTRWLSEAPAPTARLRAETEPLRKAAAGAAQCDPKHVRHSGI
eukprot:6391841-Prymnesium_polylepis.1